MESNGTNKVAVADKKLKEYLDRNITGLGVVSISYEGLNALQLNNSRSIPDILDILKNDLFEQLKEEWRSREFSIKEGNK